jgi:hypothetical protein
MISLEIPDPFETFVSKKYANAKGAIYDFFGKEWSWHCPCDEVIYAPSRKTLTKTRLYHTRNVCYGGY